MPADLPACPPAAALQCSACGAPRWEGPGFQLEQRLAAALQAGAALGASLLPLPGGDGPAAAAAAAAAAALARFRWEAGEAGAQPAGHLPDADHAEEAGEAAVAAPLSGLPRFELEEEFEGLAELAADMLLHSSEWGHRPLPAARLRLPAG